MGGLPDRQRPFGWRFFGPDMAREPFPSVMPKNQTARYDLVFVFGESAASRRSTTGIWSQPRFWKPCWRGRSPANDFEVVNTAMTAINSHVILPIARDCAGQNGDFWVIYMGNNEVVGPYGSGTVFGAQAAKLAMVRAGVAFKATRIDRRWAAWFAICRSGRPTRASGAAWLCSCTQPRSPGGPSHGHRLRQLRTQFERHY